MGHSPFRQTFELGILISTAQKEHPNLGHGARTKIAGGVNWL